jgi:hypothetical protein
MADVRYREVMTILIFLVGVAAAIATFAGYVAWRDRRGRESSADPSISRDALARRERHARRTSTPTLP